MYSFHASALAYMEFWNNSFGKTQQDVVCRLSCRQVWQAFVQESIRTIAASADVELSVRDNLAIDEITKEAFSILGENGVIRAADQHACSECTHDYIATTFDNTPTADSAAVVGVDEDVEQPPQQATDSGSSSSSGSTDDGMDVDKAPVKMVVVDGTCFGPKHCAYENCADDLINYRSAVFCAIHEQAHDAKCHVRNCDNTKSEEHKHVNSISSNGRNMSLNTNDNLHLVFEELHKGQLKTCLGFQQMCRQNNHMMNQWRKWSIKIILVLLGFTVLKQYVHHVVLL